MKAEPPGHLPFPPFTDWFGWSEKQRNHDELRCDQKQSPSMISICYSKYWHLHSHPSWRHFCRDFEGIILRKNRVEVHVQFRDPHCYTKIWINLVCWKLTTIILFNQGTLPQGAAISYTGVVLRNMATVSSAYHYCQCKHTHVLLPRLSTSTIHHHAYKERSYVQHLQICSHTLSDQSWPNHTYMYIYICIYTDYCIY